MVGEAQRFMVFFIRGFTQFVLLVFLPSVLQVLLLQLILVQFVVKKKLNLGFLPNWVA